MKKILLFLLILFTGTVLFAQQKYALVIGNSNYTGIGSLRNPVNDARDMRDALQSLGFTVNLVLNGNLDQMETAIQNFIRRLSASPNSYGFFFFAGHGVESGGENYLIPVDAANIRSETHLRQRAVSVQTLLDSLNEAENELNMIVLDACRDNPFGWSRSGGRGLAVVSRVPTGSIVMFAAASGNVADDGTGRNGLFTGQLLNSLRMPGQSVFHVFDTTMGDVIRVSGGRQHPELRIMFPGASSIYLGSQPASAPASTPNPASIPIPADFVHINGGTFQMGSPAGEPGRINEETQRRITLSGFYMAKNLVTQAEYEAIMGTNPSHFKGENLPVENISWFDAIEYCNRRSQQEGLTPAYTISGSGTNRTVTWDRNANGYRLPTEAEWEYACRAGTTTAYNTGSTITSNQANINNTLGRTTQVGSYSPNAWGLNDMHGNVWEWCWDWYGIYPSGAQTDPVGAPSGSFRTLRGGSWNIDGRSLRSAYRNINSPSYRNNNIGFRVVRSL